MAIIAGIATGNVGRVFADGNRAIVAGRTDANDLRVVNPVSRCEDHAVMAVLADVGRLDMRRGFTNRISTVMAAEAVARNIDVIEVGRYPPVGRVTLVAGIAARYVCGVLPRGDRAIVTGRTGTNDLQMLNPVGRCEDHVVVAVLANIGCPDMCRVLADCLCAVVAVKTIVHDCRVIEGCGGPADCGVAVVAIVAAVNVCRMLADGNPAVVTS